MTTPRPDSTKPPSPQNGAILYAVGRWIRELFAVLEPSRWSLALTLVGIIAFLGVDQGQDSLRRMAESRRFLWFAALTSTAVWAWTLSAWYWARTVLCVDTGTTAPGLRTWIPRLLGVTGWLGWSWALLRASSTYRFVETDTNAKANLLLLGLVSLGMTAAFLAFVITRRRMFSLGDVRVQSQRLDAKQRWIVVVTVVAATLLLAVFTAAPIAVAPRLGTAAIVLFTFAVWIFFGSATVMLGKRWGMPLVTVGVGLAFVFSFWNDNHAMRTLEGSRASVDNRPTVDAKLKDWLPPEGPIFLVVAEGGGIRAAYWSGAVLGALHDRTEGRFSRHLFAQSTVSGGSLGAAVYTALVAEQAAGGLEGTLRARAKDVLGRDFLSPVLGMMLGPDALQRFLPFPVSVFDRARGLEDGWEDGWEDAIANDRLGRGMLELGTDQRLLIVPSLVLNTTHVGTGMPWYVSDIELGHGELEAPDQGDDDDEPESDTADRAMPDASELDTRDTDTRDTMRSGFERGDLLAAVGRDLPLSAAIHNSARFLYVSPAGTFRATDDQGNQGPVQRLVDGGYFENFGATRATQLVQEITEACKDCRDRIVVIAITNGEPTAPATDRAANELLAPIRTLLRTRSARGTLSLETLCTTVAGVPPDVSCTEARLPTQPAKQRFFHFSLCAQEKIRGRYRPLPLPLGWDLSYVAQTAMDRQLDRPQTGPAICSKHQRNLDNLDALDNLLEPRTTVEERLLP